MGLAESDHCQAELTRAIAARREETLLMLWATLQSRTPVLENDLRQGLTSAQWRRFACIARDLLTDSKPVSEDELREYFRLLKIADDMWKTLHPKRKKRRNLAWHTLRAEMGEAYCRAAIELTKVIAAHPAVTVMLFPISDFHSIADWIKLNQCAGHMPILKRHMTGHQEDPVQTTRPWQSAAYDFVRELIRKKYPKAAIFQGDADF